MNVIFRVVVLLWTSFSFAEDLEKSKKIFAQFLRANSWRDLRGIARENGEEFKKMSVPPEFISMVPRDTRKVLIQWVQKKRGPTERESQKIFDEIDRWISKISFKKLPGISSLRDPEKGLDLSKVPESLREFFELVIENYFDRLSGREKRNLMAGLIELPINATKEDQLLAILNGAGPVMQKAFQLFGDSAHDPQIKKILGEMKNNIRPMPYYLVESEFKKSYGVNPESYFEVFNKKSLAAATIGQVHKGVLAGDDVIVKIRRAGIKQRAEEEIKILRSLATNSGVSKVIDGLEDSLLEELDFRLEAHNIDKGKIYNRSGFHSIDRLPGATHENVLLMSMAKGKSLNKIEENAGLTKKLSEFLGIWFNEALFGSGFFHGDLHAGNMFFDSENNLLTLIDFGAVGKLSKKEQRAVLKMSLGAVYFAPSPILNALSELIDLDNDTRQKLGEGLKEVMKNRSLPPGKILNMALNKALELGIPIPRSLVLFGRGKSFLEKQLENRNVDPQDLVKKVVTKYLSFEIVMKILGRQNPLESVMDDEALSVLVWESFRHLRYCSQKGALAVYSSFIFEMIKMFEFYDPLQSIR